ncbi:nodulation protein NodH [Thalassovita sp.]|jgi:LPS sulfotransferase NodH|uniref:nodulation protein NodH n=1 Tax=Thalassovita sp. TaxID=1979401 RepID=UPI003B58D785
MSGNFDYFVVLAEMRTGSNFLEANLNAFDGISCHGEAFNPAFIGYPNAEDILGVTQAEREDNPDHLINTIRDQAGALGGFRFFHDHDPRVIDRLLSDPRCAKIILTRNPAESYVSWKIAQSTGQWKLTNMKRRKEGSAVFAAPEFEQHLSALQQFQIKVLNALQVTGQTGFYVDYEDLQSLEVLNGLAQWLGVDQRLDALDSKLKKQNPQPLSAKVENFDEMETALEGLDRFNLTRTPNFEPRRGAAVPGYVAAAQAPLLFLPIPAGPEAQVVQWLADVDSADLDALQSGFSQRTLRHWRQTTPGHRSFTVLRHPVARAHHAFCQRILNDGPGHFARIRKILRQVYKLPLPKSGVPEGYDARAHRAAFMVFLDFVGDNLAGQTSVRLDPHWASQVEVIRGFTAVAAPDFVLREAELTKMLPILAGKEIAYQPAPQDMPIALSEIYDDEIEQKVRAVYKRDYVSFGFENWKDQAA